MSVYACSYGVASSSILFRSVSFLTHYFPLLYMISCAKFQILNHRCEKLMCKFVTIKYSPVQVVLNSTMSHYNVLITNLHSIFQNEFIIYSKLKHVYITYFKLTLRYENEFIINLCACTQNGAILHKRRMVHMCMYAEWCKRM